MGGRTGSAVSRRGARGPLTHGPPRRAPRAEPQGPPEPPPRAASPCIARCPWADSDPQMRRYHDREWGVPERSSRRLWEKLALDGFQAGLSWRTILRKRAAFRRAFAGFDPTRVARFTERDVRRLLRDPGIVRSRAKIVATIDGARAMLAMERAGLPFAKFVWGYVGGAPRRGTGRPIDRNRTSTALSAELRRRGFRFVGPVIVYAWMQAVGLVNDHVPGCFRRSEVDRDSRRGRRALSAQPPRRRIPRSRSTRAAIDKFAPPAARPALGLGPDGGPGSPADRTAAGARRRGRSGSARRGGPPRRGTAPRPRSEGSAPRHGNPAHPNPRRAPAG